MATFAKCALVSTNSVCQGDAVATLWKPLFAQGVSIDFAHHTFRWDSESNSKAHVHCVIVGFSCGNPRSAGILPAAGQGVGGAASGRASENDAARRDAAPPAAGILPAETAPPSRAGSPRSQEAKMLFDGDRVSLVPHFNAYLLPAPDVFVESRREALSADRPLVFGSMPNDGGFLSDWSPPSAAATSPSASFPPMSSQATSSFSSPPRLSTTSAS